MKQRLISLATLTIFGLGAADLAGAQLGGGELKIQFRQNGPWQDDGAGVDASGRLRILAPNDDGLNGWETPGTWLYLVPYVFVDDELLDQYPGNDFLREATTHLGSTQYAGQVTTNVQSLLGASTAPLDAIYNAAVSGGNVDDIALLSVPLLTPPTGERPAANLHLYKSWNTPYSDRWTSMLGDLTNNPDTNVLNWHAVLDHAIYRQSVEANDPVDSNWFRTVAPNLLPGASLMLQVIGIQDDTFATGSVYPDTDTDPNNHPYGLVSIPGTPPKIRLSGTFEVFAAGSVGNPQADWYPAIPAPLEYSASPDTTVVFPLKGRIGNCDALVQLPSGIFVWFPIDFATPGYTQLYLPPAMPIGDSVIVAVRTDYGGPHIEVLDPWDRYIIHVQ